MTENEAIQIGRALVAKEGRQTGNGIRVVDLDKHIADCERDSGKKIPEHLRIQSEGMIIVWFEIPHPPDVVITPGEFGVHVNSRSGQAVFYGPIL